MPAEVQVESIPTRTRKRASPRLRATNYRQVSAPRSRCSLRRREITKLSLANAVSFCRAAEAALRKREEKNKNNVWGRSFYERSSTFFLFFFLFRGIVKPRKCLHCQFHSDKSFQERRLLHKVDFSGWWVIATQQLLTLSNLPLYVYILICL